MNEKKNVKAFMRKFKIKTVNSSSIKDAMGKQGFTVIEYNGIDDSDDVNALGQCTGTTDTYIGESMFRISR